jgi:hypothetical protein
LSKAAAVLLLVAADAAFLWMFLSTGPLEQIAGMRALRFASDWRHGMSGNAWIYMPGFFATAAAIWLHERVARPATVLRQRASAGAIALLLAYAASIPASAAVIQQFAATSAFAIPRDVPLPGAACAAAAGYTLLAWSAFVLGCRGALVRRSWRPFVPAALLAAGLLIVRRWTVDEFSSAWAAGIASGDPIAVGSLLLSFAIAGLLVASERDHRSHNAASCACPRAERRATSTNSV